MPADSETRRCIIQEFHDRVGAWAQMLGDAKVWAAAAEEGRQLLQGVGNLDTDQVAAALHDEGHPAQAQWLRDWWTDLIGRRVYPLLRWTCGTEGLDERLDKACGPCGEPSEKFRKNPADSPEVIVLCARMAEMQAAMQRILAPVAANDGVESVPQEGGTDPKGDERLDGAPRVRARTVATIIAFDKYDARELKGKWDRRRCFYPRARGKAKSHKAANVYDAMELIDRARKRGDFEESHLEGFREEALKLPDDLRQ